MKGAGINSKSTVLERESVHKGQGKADWSGWDWNWKFGMEFRSRNPENFEWGEKVE